MNTAQPILVLHGIGNRVPAGFAATVAQLQSDLGRKFRLIDVFWGDLAGNSEYLADALPPGGGATSVRAPAPAQRRLRGTPVLQRLDAADYVSQQLAPEVTPLGRVRSPQAPSAGLREAVHAAILASSHLRRMDDVEVLQQVVTLIRQGLAVAPPDAVGRRPRGLGMAERIAQTVAAIDKLIGSLTGNLGGTLNQFVRSHLAYPVALTLGDIVAYHQNRDAIQARLFHRLDQEAPGWGKAERPLGVMAHSLGGLLAFDAALGEGSQRCLWIDQLVTFGSQPAFFHILAPRLRLARYRAGRKVRLPGSIMRWTNLWHSLDVLAFVTAPIFELADGHAPLDVEVRSAASILWAEKGWLHSVYWECPELRHVWTCRAGESAPRNKKSPLRERASSNVR